MEMKCPHCGNNMSVSEQQSGQTVNCPSCGKPVGIPAMQAPQAQPVSMMGQPAGGVRYVKSHRAGTILALGVLGLVICAPLGIFAIVMGNTDLKEMDNGIMDPSGRSTTNAGRICGIIAVALWAVGAIVWAIIAAIAWSGAGA